MANNGWNGLDPVLRVLRAIAVLAFLGMLGVLVIDQTRRDETLVFVLLGAILLALGYPIAVRAPGWFRTTNGKTKDDRDDG